MQKGRRARPTAREPSLDVPCSSDGEDESSFRWFLKSGFQMFARLLRRNRRARLLTFAPARPTEEPASIRRLPRFQDNPQADRSVDALRREKLPRHRLSSAHPKPLV